MNNYSKLTLTLTSIQNTLERAGADKGVELTAYEVSVIKGLMYMVANQLEPRLWKNCNSTSNEYRTNINKYKHQEKVNLIEFCEKLNNSKVKKSNFIYEQEMLNFLIVAGLVKRTAPELKKNIYQVTELGEKIGIYFEDNTEFEYQNIIFTENAQTYFIVKLEETFAFNLNESEASSIISWVNSHVDFEFSSDSIMIIKSSEGENQSNVQNSEQNNIN